MTERWLIIGKDERMKLLAKKLSSPLRTVYYKCTDNWDTTMNATALEFDPQIVVLPIQPLRIDVETIYGLQRATIFAGRLNDKWKSILQDNALHYYLQDESFIWNNAALTGEALLAHLYKEGMSLKGKTIFITGFGRVAIMTAHLFHQLGAKIIIAVRSEVQRAEAMAYGYKAQSLIPQFITTPDVIINTIPSCWLTEKFSAYFKLPIYDVASAPGCLQDITLSQYELLPALPGKYFPSDAAQLLYESILEQLRSGKLCSKEKE